MKFLVSLLKHVGFSLYCLATVVSMTITFYYLSSRGHTAFSSWIGVASTFGLFLICYLIFIRLMESR